MADVGVGAAQSGICQLIMHLSVLYKHFFQQFLYKGKTRRGRQGMSGDKWTFLIEMYMIFLVSCRVIVYSLIRIGI